MTETSIRKAIQVALVKIGVKLFRNNTGELQDKAGRWVSFGLCPGSSDLIGWKSIVVTQDMVGKPIAVFVAIEVKAPNAKTERKRLELQINFLKAVQTAGGYAGMVCSEDDAFKVVGRDFWKAN